MSKGAFIMMQASEGKMELLLLARQALIRRMNIIKLKTNKSATINDIQRTHSMFIKRIYKPHILFAYEYFKVSQEGASTVNLIPGGGNRVRFPLKGNNGDMLSDMAVHITFQAVGGFTSAETTDPVTPASPKYRYCDYPGIRLLKNVSFRVDGTLIDEYERDDVLFYMRNVISESNTMRFGWNRLVGQQTYSELKQYYDSRQLDLISQVGDGAQTPRAAQPALDLWIPLIFWFNQSPERPVENILLGTEQKYIDIELASLEEIIRATDANNAQIALPISQLSIQKVELFTRNMFIDPEIHDALMLKGNLTIMRNFRRQKITLTTDSEDKKLLHQLKFPIEYMSFGFRPLVNLTSFDTWHLFSRASVRSIPVPAIIYNPLVVPPNQLVVRTATYTHCDPVIDNLNFLIQGQKIYSDDPTSQFWRDYTAFSAPNISNPDDCGSMFITFAAIPRKFAPTGHLNNTTAREFYITYKPAPGSISLSNQAELFVSATTINFLVYDGFTVRLRFFA